MFGYICKIMKNIKTVQNDKPDNRHLNVVFMPPEANNSLNNS